MSKKRNPIRPAKNPQDPQGAMSNVVYRPGRKRPAGRKKEAHDHYFSLCQRSSSAHH